MNNNNITDEEIRLYCDSLNNNDSVDDCKSPNDELVLFTAKDFHHRICRFNRASHFIYCRKAEGVLKEHTIQWTLPMNGLDVYDDVCDHLTNRTSKFNIQSKNKQKLTIDFFYKMDLSICCPGEIVINKVDNSTSNLTVNFKYDDKYFTAEEIEYKLEDIGKSVLWELKEQIEAELTKLFQDSGFSVALGDGVPNGFEIDEGFVFCSIMTNEQKSSLIANAHKLKFVRIISIHIHSNGNIDIMGQTEDEVRKEILSAVISGKIALREIVREVFPNMRYIPIYVDDKVYDIQRYLNMITKYRSSAERILNYNGTKLKTELKKHNTIKALKIGDGGVAIID